jgi:hypothetical protein
MNGRHLPFHRHACGPGVPGNKFCVKQSQNFASQLAWLSYLNRQCCWGGLEALHAQLFELLEHSGSEKTVVDRHPAQSFRNIMCGNTNVLK